MNRHTYRDRWPDDYEEDYEDRLPPGKDRCPECGDIVPEDHLDTDSGNCIDCEDRESDRREESAIYANCLSGYPFKKRRRA